MLRKSKGEGYSLVIKLTEKEHKLVSLFVAVRGGKADETLKQVLLDNLKFHDEDKESIQSLLS